MALSVNDLQRMGYTVAVPANAIVTGANRVMGLIVRATGATAGVLSVFNNLDGTGTADITLSTVATANACETVWFGPNGVKFATGLSAAVANGLAYVFYVAE